MLLGPLNISEEGRPVRHTPPRCVKTAQSKKLLIQASTSGMSTLCEYVTPLQFPFVTYELTARTVSVPPSRSGPPESPKQVPPLPRPGLAVSRMNSSACVKLPDTSSVGANKRTRNPVQTGGPPPRVCS